MSLSVPPSSPNTLHEECVNLQRIWWMLLLLGLISLVLGFVAISATFVTTLASVVVLGILALVASGAEVVHAFVSRNGRGFLLHVLAAVLYLVVGLFMVRDPLQAAAALTLVLAISFLVGGVFRIVLALALRAFGWQWVLFSGVIDLILGGMIWSEWPEATEWVIGLFVGLDLIFHGWSWMMLALTVKAYKGTASENAQ